MKARNDLICSGMHNIQSTDIGILYAKTIIYSTLSVKYFWNNEITISQKKRNTLWMTGFDVLDYACICEAAPDKSIHVGKFFVHSTLDITYLMTIKLIYNIA